MVDPDFYYPALLEQVIRLYGYFIGSLDAETINLLESNPELLLDYFLKFLISFKGEM